MIGVNHMAKSRKNRLDQTLVNRGLVESRARAQALIMAGKVYSGDNCLTKAGMYISVDTQIGIRGKVHPWVSRGGLKLNYALGHFNILPLGATALDIGASTGGFTDVLLNNGAKRVYAVDVGYGQLDWKLRVDERVLVLERTNARYLNSNLIPDKLNIIVCDVSFISLQTVLPAALSLVSDSAFLVALIKPQFEVGRGQVGKGGIVREASLHEEVCSRINNWLSSIPNWKVLGITESPILGGHGNKEFLIGAEYIPL